jgi:predicted AAA+ superfamily ATPase
MDVAKTARFRVYAEVDRWPPLIRNWRIVENDVFLRLREMDAALTFWRVGRQEIDFIFHVQDVVFPVECKTGRLRSNNTRSIRSLAKKWGAPFSVMVTYDTFDFSDPLILRVPAFML